MSDLRKGYTFSGTSPNNSVTAEKLNTLVDAATILTGFYTGKTENTQPGSADYVLTYDRTASEYRKVQVGNLVPSGQARIGFRNLYASTSSSDEVYASADELVLRSDSGLLRSVGFFSAHASLSLYLGGSTAQGRDAATIPTTGVQWYYFWAISNGTHESLLLSQSNTSPVLPTGYLYKLLLGAVRLDNSGSLVRFVQRNLDVALDPPSPAGVTSPGLNPWTGAVPAEFTNVAPATARTLQGVDLSRCIPPAHVARVSGIIGSTDIGVSYAYALGLEGTSSLAGAKAGSLTGLTVLTTAGMGSGASLFGFGNAAAFDVVVDDPPYLFWTCSSATPAKHSLRITGYRLSL